MPFPLGFRVPRSRSPLAIAKRSLKRILHCQQRRLQSLSMSLAVLDDLSADELGTKLKEYSITATDTKNPLSDPYPFNLFQKDTMGGFGEVDLYGRTRKGAARLKQNQLSPYMRPETAQGIFVNFKDLYYYNGNKLLFAAAQIGQAFRNEISPCQGLLRVREFTLVEIERF
ncbi:unnamed protein product [Musa acuminata subsp. malaccensis]|uniref:(wild Malaysian banana) hypothetical protein n=1 Tax=Musa acuminata subsp. malaccensis TaxID=214687 RepID=A0A804K7Q6_MUSAM|nr:unnamed protein product [Musa acuminata subsp. malaccensis]